TVATDELIKLSESIANMLPQRRPEVMEIRFVESRHGPSKYELGEQVRALKAENERLTTLLKQAAPAQADSQNNAPAATPEAANVVPSPAPEPFLGGGWCGTAKDIELPGTPPPGAFSSGFETRYRGILPSEDT